MSNENKFTALISLCQDIPKGYVEFVDFENEKTPITTEKINRINNSLLLCSDIEDLNLYKENISPIHMFNPSLLINLTPIIKPCPFCGKNSTKIGIHKILEHSTSGGVRLICSACGSASPTTHCSNFLDPNECTNSVLKVIIDWNTRNKIEEEF